MTSVICPSAHVGILVDHLKSHDGPERLSLVAESSYTQHEVQGDAEFKVPVGPQVDGVYRVLSMRFLHRWLMNSASQSRLSSC